MNGNKQKIAIYPGTFDPITRGHISLVQRAVHLFDQLIVAVSKNAGKAPLFSWNQRYLMVRKSLEGIPKVEVIKFDGLLAELARSLKARVIIRGLRAVSDFEFEFQMALMNRKMAREVETVFLMPSLSWVYLSSTVVKDIAVNGGDISTLVPPSVVTMMARKARQSKKNR
ncbi:MAG: pantetheine-phosphate adenylyltransferase [Candidatus Zixiibacteriota bacterium]|nr:MAG: pantetheine-phosphate adenylyltransferase [candidate division Zixibacteria bacterium]